MTAINPTVLVPVFKLRAGDLIRPDGRAETVAAVSGIDNGRVTVRTDAMTRVVPSDEDVPTVALVSRPSDATGLYKADGFGVFGCTCVYRAPGGGQMHESVAEDPACPSHGADRLDDDEWD